MKVAILGSRGIPNRYGGFEELAEKLAMGLADAGHQVVVYNPSNHPVNDWKYPNVQVVSVFNPEDALGAFGQFIYDLNATRHTQKSRPQIILQLGYTSSSIWFWLWPRKCRIITNMDGLEWKRTKYSRPVQWFLKIAERLAANHSHVLVADNKGIESYLHEKYMGQVVHIPYGAHIPEGFNSAVLNDFNLAKKNYFLLIARMEPENNIQTILEGFVQTQVSQKLVVVGGLNAFGKKLKQKFASDERIVFTGAIYQKELLNNLRHYSALYFHGHSVGGTNPSLLEAMACGCHIAAHKNAFNRHVLGENACYFENAENVTQIIENQADAAFWRIAVRKNRAAVRDTYHWPTVVAQYELVMQQLLI